jgi:hypothetical protein
LVQFQPRVPISKTGEFEIIGEAGMSEFKAFPLEKVSSLNMPDFYKEAIKKASLQ